jgi:hypothetical protein
MALVLVVCISDADLLFAVLNHTLEQCATVQAPVEQHRSQWHRKSTQTCDIMESRMHDLILYFGAIEIRSHQNLTRI